jgi:histidinol-phosphate aminotransferase
MEPDFNMERLIRHDLVNFMAYSGATSPDTLKGKTDVPVKDIIKLDANENPYGCSPRVKKALGKYAGFHVYTDDKQTKIRELLSGYLNIDARHIVAGGGSNQLIDLIVRLLVNPGDEVISCTPTFGIYEFCTQLCGGSLVEVPRGENYSVNIPAVKAAVTKKTKLVCLANPNNPTGTLMPRDDILDLLDTGVPVLLDEAYYEFCGETLAAAIGHYENLMILRTFSKWAGLAGLRIGYGLFPANIADYIMRIKMPYNVNVAATIAVKESLADLDYLMENVKAIVLERERLFRELQTFGWLQPFPSQANFILCKIWRGDARQFKHTLQQKGILVRYFDTPMLRGCVRISVGKPEDTDALLKALREIDSAEERATAEQTFKEILEEEDHRLEHEHEPGHEH